MSYKQSLWQRDLICLEQGTRGRVWSFPADKFKELMTKEENEGVGKGHITGGTITHSRNYDTGVGSREDRDPHRL